MSVPAEEWFFSALDNDELAPSWFYEYLREFVLRTPGEQARKYRQEITQLRELVRGKTAKEARIILMQEHRALPSVIPVMFDPEWPATPYQAIPKDQRVQRLRDWVPEWFPDSIESLTGNLLPFRTPEEVIDALAEKLRASECPVVSTEHVHSWIDFLLSQHALGSDYRIDTIYRRYVAAIVIDPTDSEAVFLRRTKALWQMVTGNEQQARKAGRPAGSLTAKNRPELQQLGAYRMVEDFGLSVEEAIAEIQKITEQLGVDAYYADPRSFERAIDETRKRLKKFFQPPELNTE